MITLTQDESILLAEHTARAKNTRTTGQSARVREIIAKAIESKKRIISIKFATLDESIAKKTFAIGSLYNILREFSLDYKASAILSYTRAKEHNQLIDCSIILDKSILTKV